ncbi:DEAD/DEAH box helicase [Corynebacterium marquesiae]|uniref:DEAD/DEAH box helicase n=1 Tax=Corynebacterium marquesiae TaxID=2913503 RepID=UPI00254B9EF0|nr:DEAD/DEAH box helicase [Corynebacterium marquesiae]MDK8455776.1 DEAD/DEAH box helicase [Corynebacterium marquesiae]MDK8480857.1 DEAD/DEAH box helicase [Corynebacterium marquesiae]MDK8725897.1 DEAD/DEAH box helicase [Corynebacterium marquesiae]MDK8771212.1 DEAD/DEAH box helicase [Corynebacterium marquesiae]
MSDIKSQPPSFAELGVAAEICDGLATRGITRTFAIQELTLPIALSGQDLIGQARTGMGKTYGFGVPLLDRVFDDADIDELDGTPRALVVVPTRELAQQVTEDLQVAATHLPVRLASIYGGRPYEEQIKKLNKGVDVIIGTPGRLIDLHERGELQLDRVAILVLDEADEMLDLGFLPSVEAILKALDGNAHQTMLFSATMPGAILTLARRFMEKPIHIRAESGEQDFTHSSTRKVTFQAHRMDKVAVVAHALQASGRGRTIIFARTKRAAAQLADDLARRGFHVGAVHGDLGQKSREKSLQAFRTSQVDILVATDIAARGIDVDDVTHVINYQVPDDPMTFVHRIGRTGRAGHTGTAITLVGYDELGKWQVINDELDLGEPNPPQWFSTSPELAQALDIPADVEETVGPETKVVGQVPVREKSPTRTTARRGSSRRRRGGRR